MSRHMDSERSTKPFAKFTNNMPEERKVHSDRIKK